MEQRTVLPWASSSSAQGPGATTFSAASASEPPSSNLQLDLAWPPSLVEPRFQRAVCTSMTLANIRGGLTRPVYER
jgi:hypothetical protein